MNDHFFAHLVSREALAMLQNYQPRYLAACFLPLLELGCSVCSYDFAHPSSPKSKREITSDMSACHDLATTNVTIAAGTQDEQHAAAQRWMRCMRENGYAVVKRWTSSPASAPRSLLPCSPSLCRRTASPAPGNLAVRDNLSEEARTRDSEPNK